MSHEEVDVLAEIAAKAKALLADIMESSGAA